MAVAVLPNESVAATLRSFAAVNWMDNREERLMRLPLAPVERTPDPGRREPCPQCGSQGFTVHQRSSKRVLDPQVDRVAVDRYRCKRCGWVGRSYPTGVDAGRQTIGLRQLSLMLYGAGMSLATVRATMMQLGCGVSETTVRHNVDEARTHFAAEWRPQHWSFRIVSDAGAQAARLLGADGAIVLRIGGAPAEQRWLEIELPTGAGADDLRWRFEQGIRWLHTALEA